MSMKRVIALIACMAMLSVSTLAVATEKNETIDISSEVYCENVIMGIADSSAMALNLEEQLDLEKSFVLFNFSEEPIAIFYQLKPVGFAIYDFLGGKVLEYTTEINHPYYVDLSQRYYYEGVMQYYEKSEGGFRNLATGRIKEVTESYQFQSDDFYASNRTDSCSFEEMETLANEGPVVLKNSTRHYDCNTSGNMAYFFLI